MTEPKIVERQTITINKNKYYLDSLDETSQKLLGDIRTVDTEIQHQQVRLNIAGVAKNALLQKLEEGIENFELVANNTVKVEPDYINQ